VVLIVAPGCLVACWWQVHVALAGDDLGWLYSVEWPVFAVFSVVFWWYLIHDDPKARAGRIATSPGAAGTTSSPAARVDAERQVTPASASPASASPASASPASASPASASPASASACAAPAASAGVAAAEGSAPAARRWDEEDEALRAYNDYLASLAAHSSRKTWRNPSGSSQR
jgi:hypothetical protein